MSTDDPEIHRAIELLEEVIALRGRKGADVSSQLARARAAMAALGVDPDVVTDILYPPSPAEPVAPAHLHRILRRRLDDLGYGPDDLEGLELPALGREELDRRIEQAIRDAAEWLARHERPADE